MTSIEGELVKILTNQCPVQQMSKILQETDRKDLNQDIMLGSIEVLRMHEAEIRNLRHRLELTYYSEVLNRYIKQKQMEKIYHKEI